MFRAREPGTTRYIAWVDGQVGLLSREIESVFRTALHRSRNEPRTAWLRARLIGTPIGYDGAALAFFREDGIVTLAPSVELTPTSLEGLPQEELPDGQTLLEELLSRDLDDYRQWLVKAARAAIGRLERRREAVRLDIEKMKNAEKRAEDARLFVAEASRAARGQTELRALDWSDGTAIERVFHIAAHELPKVQLERIFARAKRLKDGATFARARLLDAERALEIISELCAVATVATSREELDALVQDVKACAPRDVRFGAGPTKAKAPAQKRRSPYRLFRSERATPIWVGRGGADNDTLTLRLSQSTDLWLHAKNQSGAHVIVPLHRGKSCPSDVLLDAAHLAAHFSDGRGNAVIDVQYTERRHVHKPKGSPPGFVVVMREKVLALRLEGTRLNTLLAREEQPEDHDEPPRT